MSKIHGICIPYPRELVESILRRTGFKIGLTRKELRNIITEKGIDNKPGILLFSLNLMANHYAAITGEDLLENHTTFIYDTFFNDSQSREILKNKYLNGSINLSSYLDRNNYCPRCVQQDIEKMGESWLHIEHNLMGLPFCYKCGSPLVNSNQYMDEYPLLYNAEIESYNNEFQNFIPVLKMAKDIANNRFQALQYYDARNKIRELIIGNYTDKMKKFKLQEFIKDIMAFYFIGREEEFEKISGIRTDYYINKFENMLYLCSSNYSTTAFLMIINFFNISFNDFCLIRPRIELINNQSAIIPKDVEAKIIVEKLIAEDETISLSRLIQLYPGLYQILMKYDEEWLLTRLPKKPYYMVERGTLDRVKDEIIGLIDDDKDFDLKRLRDEHGAQYSYLLRNDPEWLKKLLPSKISKQDNLENAKDIVEQLIKNQPGYTLAELIGNFRTIYCYLKRTDPEWLLSNLGGMLTIDEKLKIVKKDVELLIQENDDFTLNDLVKRHNKLYKYLWKYDPDWLYDRLPPKPKPAIEKEASRINEMKEKVGLLIAQNPGFSLTILMAKHSTLYNYLRIHDPDWLYEILPRGSWKKIKLANAKGKVEELISEKNIFTKKDLKKECHSLYCYIYRNDPIWLDERFRPENGGHHKLIPYKMKVEQMMQEDKHFSLQDLRIQDKNVYSYLYRYDPDWLHSKLPNDGYKQTRLLLAREQVENLVAEGTALDLGKLRAEHKRLYNYLHRKDKEWLFQRLPKPTSRDTIFEAKLKLDELIAENPSFCLRTLRIQHRTLYGFLLKKEPEWLNEKLPVTNIDANRFLSDDEKQEQILALFIEVYNNAIEKDYRITKGTFSENSLTKKYYYKLKKYCKIQEFIQSVCETYEDWCNRIIPRFISRMIFDKCEPITFAEFCIRLGISSSPYPYSSEIGKVAAKTVYEYFKNKDIDNTYISLPSAFLKSVNIIM